MYKGKLYTYRNKQVIKAKFQQEEKTYRIFNFFIFCLKYKIICFNFLSANV